MPDKQEKLTEKQERFCREYVKSASKSGAYRAAFDCSSMKDSTVNKRAVELYKRDKIRGRVEDLQAEQSARIELTDSVLREKITQVLLEIALDSKSPASARVSAVTKLGEKKGVGYFEDKQSSQQITITDNREAKRELMQYVERLRKDPAVIDAVRADLAKPLN